MTSHTSSTMAVPAVSGVPSHLAVIMDGNGRWAKKRFLPRIAGHKKGVESVRNVVKACSERGIKFLTLFAFSSENWRRPPDEVKFLMQLFASALRQEVEKLHESGVRFRVIGDLEPFGPELVTLVRAAEERTSGNGVLTLTIAANYGGRWDILQATNRMLKENPGLAKDGFGEADLLPYLALNFAPEPDLFIRTGGEQRISNFLLWQLAYSELYFTDVLWPDFGAAALDDAICWYGQRERRFGRTSEQLQHTDGGRRSTSAA